MIVTIQRTILIWQTKLLSLAKKKTIKQSRNYFKVPTPLFNRTKFLFEIYTRLFLTATQLLGVKLYKTNKDNWYQRNIEHFYLCQKASSTGKNLHKCFLWTFEIFGVKRTLRAWLSHLQLLFYGHESLHSFISFSSVWKLQENMLFLSKYNFLC